MPTNLMSQGDPQAEMSASWKVRCRRSQSSAEASQARGAGALESRWNAATTAASQRSSPFASEALSASASSFWRSAVTSAISLDEMWEVTALRQKLEADALSASLANGDERWEAAVVAAFHRLSKAPAPRACDASAEDWERRHRTFHDALISACGSPWLIKFVGMLTDQMERYRHYRMIRTPPKVWARDLEREHRELMDASLARNAARATELLVSHLARTAEFISALASVAAE